MFKAYKVTAAAGKTLRGVPNTAISREKLANTELTVSKIDEIPIPPLDPFIIGHAYLKLPTSCVFIYLKHVSTMSKTY